MKDKTRTCRNTGASIASMTADCNNGGRLFPLLTLLSCKKQRCSAESPKDALYQINSLAVFLGRLPADRCRDVPGFQERGTFSVDWSFLARGSRDHDQDRDEQDCKMMQSRMSRLWHSLGSCARLRIRTNCSRLERLRTSYPVLSIHSASIPFHF